MEPPSSPSSTITAPPDYHETAVRLGKLIAEAMTCCFVLHYNSASKLMIEWYWPDDDKGKTIIPSGFEKYRDEGSFRYPCCLCAYGCGKEAHTEVAVYRWKDKATQETYWRVRCASNVCGYQVRIDRYYRLSHIATFQYRHREHDELCHIQLEWTYQEQMELFKTLESPIGNGIMTKEFQALFRHCKRCSRVGARSVMNRHIYTCSRGVQKQRPSRDNHHPAASLLALKLRL
ncbi:hypothetical protein P692DRAFT_20752457 [Suillus brevipes Sb2]|nr:hypothetical protein P692DRAFT_20752457 [Suillus brevipes Sb2]